MKKLFLSPLIVGISLLTGCAQKTEQQQNKTETTVSDTIIVGNDKDAHGCIGTAGYIWSEVRQECIRVFESGVQMISTTDPNATSVVYIVFSADSLRTEIFLPDQSKSEVLDRRSLPKGGFTWNVEDDDTKNIRCIDGVWRIDQRGKEIYKQNPATLPIHAVFTGTDEKSRRSYQLTVVFTRTGEGHAVINLDGTIFDLTQYLTADGYGYKNDKANLRGRGREATLTFSDGLVLTLTEQLKNKK